MAKNTKSSTALAKQDEAKTALAQLDPGLVLEDAQNNPQFHKDDLAIPFLKVLQTNSPEVNKRDEAHVKGAEPGDFFNTVTQRVIKGEDPGAIVIPVHYEPSYIEWRMLEQGGGFVKDHGANASIMESTQRDDKGRDVLPNGNQVVRSGLYYVLVFDPETGVTEEAAFALKGTQLKKSRKWNSLMASVRVDHNGSKIVPAMFYMSYSITTVPESNDKGEWLGVKIAPHKTVLELGGAELYMAAREFRGLVQSGQAKVTPVPLDEGMDDDAF